MFRDLTSTGSISDSDTALGWSIKADKSGSLPIDTCNFARTVSTTCIPSQLVARRLRGHLARKTHQPHGLGMRCGCLNRKLSPPLAQVRLEHVTSRHAENIAQFDCGRGFARVRGQVRRVIPD